MTNKVIFITNDKRIKFNHCPCIMIRDNKVFITDASKKLTREEIEEAVANGAQWRTIKGAHVLIGANGEQIAGPDIDSNEKEKLIPWKQGEPLPEHLEKMIGKKIPPNWKM